MQETQDVQNDNDLTANEAALSHEMSPEEKRAESYRIRLAKARKDHEEEAKRADALAKQLSDLKKKFESGSATSNEASEYINTENTIKQAQVQGIHPDDLPYIVSEKMKEEKLRQQIEDAFQKDPELRSLMNEPNASQKISGEELSSFKYLDNAPAVFKHLLKNDKDLMVFKATEQAYANGDGGTAYYTFLNNLSDKLKDTSKYPHPPKFKEISDLSDVGESDSFDVTSYIKKKYR